MLTNALVFLVTTVCSLLSFAFLLRFLLQLTRAPYQNPLSHAVINLTNFAVKPARRVIPGWKGLDLSTLVLVLLVELTGQFLSKLLNGFPLLLAGSGAWVGMALLAVLGLVETTIYIFIYAVFIQAILSWINPVSPIADVLEALTRPVLQPLRKIVPMMGNLDISSLVFIILAQMVVITVLAPVKQMLMAFF